MSSLNVSLDPAGWRAYPSPDTSIAQLAMALGTFPEIQIERGENDDIYFVLAHASATPPTADAIAAAMYSDDEELIVSSDTGEHRVADCYEQEAKDRNAEGA